MTFESRRAFVSDVCKLAVGAIAIGSLSANAAETPEAGVSGDGVAVDTTAENRCATCQFWGGMRKVSEDKAQVLAQSLGWCNNANSPNHGKLTPPDHEMKKAGVWKRWAALS